MRIMSLPEALVSCSPRYYESQPVEMRSALSMSQADSTLVRRLLEGGHSKVAGRLAGAFRNIGRERTANAIVEAMRAADYTVVESDPLSGKSLVDFGSASTPPQVNRLQLIWESFREPILRNFSAAPGRPIDIRSYLGHVEDVYATDAYHSLSIEGYHVSEELIERVRAGDWRPETRESDRDHLSALAARGYWQAFQEVRKSIERVLKGQKAGNVASEDHGIWYRELFAPSVAAGLLPVTELAGYRHGAVYLSESMHVPPNFEIIHELMEAFFELLVNEPSPEVRVVAGHFVFVYIHPYMDGNGRMGRFLMNVMLASSGYPWITIPVEKRDAYMATLETASVDQDIVPFTRFLDGYIGQ